MRRLALVPLLAPAAIAACGRSVSVSSSAPAIAAATTTDITAADLRRRLAIVADDSMQGREAGCLGSIRATDYVARELARLRLEPAGDGGTWFQNIPLMTRSVDTNSVLVVLPAGAPAGAKPSATLTYPRDLVPLPAVGPVQFGAMFHGARVPVVYGGRLGDPTLISPEQAKGKLVIFAPRTGAIGGNAFALFATFDGLAAYRDAWGIAIAGLETLPPFIGNFLKQPRDVLVDASIPRPAPMPGAFITTAAAELLLGGPIATMSPGAAGGLTGGHVAFADRPTPYPARNVIGIVRGTDPMLRNELVAIGAHTDHVGMGRPLDHDSVRAFNQIARPGGLNDPLRDATPDEWRQITAIRDSLARIRPSKRDSIFNGADDDGSGTVVALEIAEWFAAHPAKRSILFVFHTAEEKGLYGAAYWTDHPTVSRDAIVAQLNMDQVSRGGPSDVKGASPDVLYTIGLRRLSSELGDIVDAVNAKQSPPFRFDPVLDAPGHPMNAYCRSDHYMYARYGIPVAFVSRAFHRDYHMVSDEPQYADAEVMRRVGLLVRDVAARVSDLDHRPVVDKQKPDPRGSCTQ